MMHRSHQVTATAEEIQHESVDRENPLRVRSGFARRWCTDTRALGEPRSTSWPSWRTAGA